MDLVHVAILISSSFLLRVQSETVGLEVGEKCESQVLPTRRHSAVWVETCQGGKDTLHIRLAKRKHSPQGSILMRRCACADAPSYCCVVHVVAPMLRGSVGCEKIFDFSAASFLKQVRRLLTLLGHPSAQQCTLKGFRAGRATSLAATVSPLCDILAAGEWRLSAFLRYCQTDELSVPGLLAVVVENDADED